MSFVCASVGASRHSLSALHVHVRHKYIEYHQQDLINVTFRLTVVHHLVDAILQEARSEAQSEEIRHQDPVQVDRLERAVLGNVLREGFGDGEWCRGWRESSTCNGVACFNLLQHLLSQTLTRLLLPLFLLLILRHPRLLLGQHILLCLALAMNRFPPEVEALSGHCQEWDLLFKL